MPGRLLSLGSISADFEMRVDRPPGEVETLPARDLLRAGGGKAANVAVLAQRLGCRAQLIGCVGDDDLAGQALDGPRAAGVDIAGVRRTRGHATGLSIVLVPPDGRKHIVATSGANMACREADIHAFVQAVSAADRGDALVVDWEITALAASRAVAAARDSGLRIVVDPSYPDAIDPADLRHVTAIAPNQSEAMILAGLGPGGADALEAAAQAIARMGPQTVCIKLDDGGCLAWHEGAAWHQASAPVDVLDATGAGDAFTGALAVALLEGRPPLDAVAFAVAAAELSVLTYGAQPSYPTRAALEDRLRTVHRTVSRWRG